VDRQPEGRESTRAQDSAVHPCASQRDHPVACSTQAAGSSGHEHNYERTWSVPGGQNGEEGREGGRAENGGSVTQAFIASTPLRGSCPPRDLSPAVRTGEPRLDMVAAEPPLGDGLYRFVLKGRVNNENVDARR